MSDRAEILIQIDALVASERRRIVRDTTTWLCGTGVISLPDRAEANRNEELGRTSWVPGPGWREAVDEVPGGRFDSSDYYSVVINSEIDNRSAFHNYEPWRCLRCSSELDESTYAESWMDTKREPMAMCRSCGWAALLGDWPGDYPAILVGAPIVEFRNWHPLRPLFIAELTSLLGGGRCRHFVQRI